MSVEYKRNGRIRVVIREQLIQQLTNGETHLDEQDLAQRAVATLRDGDFVYSLNITASEVWKLLGEPRTVEEIATELQHKFSAPLSDVRAGVESLLQTFAARGWVERIDADS